MKLGERKIMKFFKKALIATAVVSTFGAQAVSLTTGINNSVSKQGLAAGLDAIIAINDTTEEQELRLQFSPGVETPAASTITLTFSDGVDLGGLHSAVADVNNEVTAGRGNITVDSGNAYFNYGTGDSTFDAVDVGTASGNDFIEFVINDGNALEINSSFSFVFEGADDADGVELQGDDEVCYKSVNPAGDLLEEKCFPFSEIVDQFAFGVTQPYNGKIERVDKQAFARDYENATNEDNLGFYFTNDEGLAASLDDVNVEFTMTADFTDVNDFAGSDTDVAITSIAVAGDEEVTFEILAGTTPDVDGSKNSYILGFDADTDLVDVGNDVIPQTGDIDISAAFVLGFDKTTLMADAGEWRLDAAVINVPYVPVLFPDTSSSIHIANESNSKAEVRATMITEAGLNGAAQEHSAEVILGFVPANSLVKFTQTQLADAFGITTKTKLSVTFNIDAMPKDVSAYATVQNLKGRTEVSNSQQIEGNEYNSTP